MNPERVASRGLAIMASTAGALPGYRLVFNKVSQVHPDGAHANIEYHPPGTVEGVLYTLADASEILLMDPYEKAPWNYGRDAVMVATAAGPQWAWTYFANPAVLAADLRPPFDYMAHLLAGADYLSQDYLAWLRAHPTAHRQE